MMKLFLSRYFRVLEQFIFMMVGFVVGVRFDVAFADTSMAIAVVLVSMSLLVVSVITFWLQGDTDASIMGGK